MSKQLKNARNLAALGGGALVAASPFVVSGTAQAATFTVTSLTDDGTGYTLREALVDANANADADVITFQAGLSGTITLTDRLDILHSVDIQGPGASVVSIDANDTDMVFYVYDAGALAEVSISGLTLTGGLGSSRQADAGALTVFGDNLTLDDMVITGNTGRSAGAVYFAGNYNDDDASLTIRDCEISGNTGNNWGGAIYLYNGGDADTPALLMEDTTVSGNTAAGGYGGGLYIGEPAGEVHISNSTFSGNASSTGDGGAIFVNDESAGVHIVHSTIVGNSAGYGGGVMVEDNTATDDAIIENSIIAGNTASSVVPADASAGMDIFTQDPATVAIDYSLIGSTVGYTSTGAHNLSGDPMLGALAANGGLGKTHLPQAGSPVIDAGDPAFAAPPSLDQRGAARVAGAHIDMGAVEVQPAALPPTGGSNGLMAGLGAALLGLGGALHLTGRRKRTA